MSSLKYTVMFDIGYGQKLLRGCLHYLKYQKLGIMLNNLCINRSISLWISLYKYRISNFTSFPIFNFFGFHIDFMIIKPKQVPYEPLAYNSWWWFYDIALSNSHGVFITLQSREQLWTRFWACRSQFLQSNKSLNWPRQVVARCC